MKEAERRGLSNLRSTVDSLPHFMDKKSIELFTKHAVFTRTEIEARCEILLESYYKTIDIEALTFINMAEKEIMHAALKYESAVAGTLKEKKELNLSAPVEEKLMEQASHITESIYKKLNQLKSDMDRTDKGNDALALAKYHREVILSDMDELAEAVNELEDVIPGELWPYPTYGQMLYSVR